MTLLDTSIQSTKAFKDWHFELERKGWHNQIELLKCFRLQQCLPFCAQLGQQNREKHKSYIQSLAIGAYVHVSANWVCPTKLFPPDYNPPPQQVLADFHGQQSKMLQRDRAGNLSSSHQKQSATKGVSSNVLAWLQPEPLCHSRNTFANFSWVRGSVLKLSRYQLFKCFSENSPNRTSPVKLIWKNPPRNQCCALYSFFVVNKYCITYTMLTLKDFLPCG